MRSLLWVVTFCTHWIAHIAVAHITSKRCVGLDDFISYLQVPMSLSNDTTLQMLSSTRILNITLVLVIRDVTS